MSMEDGTPRARSTREQRLGKWVGLNDQEIRKLIEILEAEAVRLKDDPAESVSILAMCQALRDG